MGVAGVCAHISANQNDTVKQGDAIKQGEADCGCEGWGEGEQREVDVARGGRRRGAEPGGGGCDGAGW